MNYQIEDKAYLKSILHAIKYSSHECIGVLIGVKED